MPHFRCYECGRRLAKSLRPSAALAREILDAQPTPYAAASIVKCAADSPTNVRALLRKRDARTFILTSRGHRRRPRKREVGMDLEIDDVLLFEWRVWLHDVDVAGVA